jgi:hypothetical protein
MWTLLTFAIVNASPAATLADVLTVTVWNRLSTLDVSPVVAAVVAFGIQ